VVVRRHPLNNKCRPRTFDQQLVRVGTPPLTHTVLNSGCPPSPSSSTLLIAECADNTKLYSPTVVETQNTTMLNREIKYKILTINVVVCGDLNCPGPLPDQVDAGLAAALDSLGLSLLVNAARNESLLDVRSWPRRRHSPAYSLTWTCMTPVRYVITASSLPGSSSTTRSHASL